MLFETKNVPKGGVVLGDAMCGGGGSTTGMLRFFRTAGIPIKRFVAINHNPDAINCHELNHPDDGSVAKTVVHYCKDVNMVSLREAFPDGRADLIWASPTCSQFSRARGGRPIRDQERNGPWELLTIATELDVIRFCIENVPEFITWSRLNGSKKASKDHYGEYFQSWKSAMEGLGYAFEWRVTNAADHGACTTRERFLALLTRKGKNHWAIPQFSRDGLTDLFTGPTRQWRGSRDYLDFSLPSNPILGRRVPLSAPTLSRGWYGMLDIWGAGATRVFSPDVRDACDEGLTYNRREIIKAKERLRSTSRKNGKAAKPPSAKLRKKLLKRVARLEKGVPRYEQLQHAVKAFLAAASGGTAPQLEPFIVTLRGTSDAKLIRSARDIDQPTSGISANGGHHIVTVPILETLVGPNRSNNRPRPTSSPGATITAIGNFNATIPVLNRFLCGNRTHNVARSENAPSATITTAHGGGQFLVAPYTKPLVLGQHGGGIARSPEQPASTITQGGAASMVSAQAQPIDPECLDQAVVERLLIDQDGSLYVAHVYFRMLHPQKELARLMGFPKSYMWPESATVTTRLVGNACQVDWVEAHVAAQCGPVYIADWSEQAYHHQRIARVEEEAKLDAAA